MIEANMLEAKTKLSQLVEAVERGEQVFLKRNGIRVAQIVPMPKKKFPFGFLKGKGAATPGSLLFRMPEEEFSDFTKL